MKFIITLSLHEAERYIARNLRGIPDPAGSIYIARQLFEVLHGTPNPHPPVEKSLLLVGTLRERPESNPA